MTTAHHLVAWVVVLLRAAALIVASWSWLTGRRAGGRADHRFAVDRIVLGVLALVGLAELLGLLILAGGERPSDSLHLLYGVAALIVLPVAWGLGGRTAGGATTARTHRDAWLVVGAAVMLAVELRLFMTG